MFLDFEKLLLIKIVREVNELRPTQLLKLNLINVPWELILIWKKLHHLVFISHIVQDGHKSDCWNLYFEWLVRVHKMELHEKLTCRFVFQWYLPTKKKNLITLSSCFTVSYKRLNPKLVSPFTTNLKTVTCSDEFLSKPMSGGSATLSVHQDKKELIFNQRWKWLNIFPNTKLLERKLSHSSTIRFLSLIHPNSYTSRSQ